MQATPNRRSTDRPAEHGPSTWRPLIWFVLAAAAVWVIVVGGGA